jgi:hypothetical protein
VSSLRLTRHKTLELRDPDTRVRPGWCKTHRELAYQYSDKSITCVYDLVTESSNEHEFVPGWLELPVGATKR